MSIFCQALAVGAGAISLHEMLREWERGRLERTTHAQIASFLMGSKSYGEAKFAEAMASSGISAEVGRCRMTPG